MANNSGSRDGDGAAAMRYTETRLAPITRLLLDEIDEGAAEFVFAVKAIKGFRDLSLQAAARPQCLS